MQLYTTYFLSETFFVRLRIVSKNSIAVREVFNRVRRPLFRPHDALSCRLYMNFLVALPVKYSVLLCWFLFLCSFSCAARALSRKSRLGDSPNNPSNSRKVRPFLQFTKNFVKQDEVASLIEESRSLVSSGMRVKAKHLAGALAKTFAENRYIAEGDDWNNEEGLADMSPDCQKQFKALVTECHWFGGSGS